MYRPLSFFATVFLYNTTNCQDNVLPLPGKPERERGRAREEKRRVNGSSHQAMNYFIYSTTFCHYQQNTPKKNGTCHHVNVDHNNDKVTSISHSNSPDNTHCFYSFPSVGANNHSSLLEIFNIVIAIIITIVVVFVVLGISGIKK